MPARIPDLEQALIVTPMLAETTEEAARLIETAGELEPRHFHHSGARAAWIAVRELVREGRRPDAVSVASKLAGRNSRGNPHAFLGQILDSVPRFHDLGQLAQLIRERAPDPDAGNAEREDEEEDARAGIFAPVSVAELYDHTSDRIDWLLHGLIPMGALVLLAAFMKAGKTTLAYALVAAILRGAPFLDRETRQTNVLLLVLEEHRRDAKRRLLKFGVPRDAGLFVQFRPVPTTPVEWAALVRFLRAHSIGLVVVDTLARCWPVWGVENENDNAVVAAALAPMLDVCRDLNVTALLLHHTGKLNEGFGREVRGAGAILALADQALLFDRYRSGDPCDRIIRTLGRYDESPAEIIVRYDKTIGTYAVAQEEAQSEEARGAERLFPPILTYLRACRQTGASLRKVRENVHGGRHAVKDQALGLLVESGRVALRDGRYVHGDYVVADQKGVA